MVTLVVRHAKVAWFHALGMSDRDSGKPMRTDAMFRICSMNKPITSVAARMLYEEGKFLRDDPVSKCLPEFKNAKVLVKPASGEPYGRNADLGLLPGALCPGRIFPHCVRDRFETIDDRSVQGATAPYRAD
jgi:Beta-lactamase